MTNRAPLAFVLTIAVLACACQGTETSTAPVTSSTPAGSSTAPSSAAAKHRDEALVRVVHAVPGGAQLDLLAGDLVLFDGLSFKSVTPYRAIDGQRYAFSLKPAGMPQARPLSSNTEGLQDGHFYTAIALPGDGHSTNLRVVGDRLAPPASGKAELRVIHAGIDAGTLDIRAAGSADALYDDVAFQTVSEYRDITPISGVIEVAANGRVVTSFNARLEAGRHYTVVIVGSANASPRLEAFLIEDALGP
jgi:hypothetical protein